MIFYTYESETKEFDNAQEDMEVTKGKQTYRDENI